MTPTDVIPADIARFLVPGEPCVVAVVGGDIHAPDLDDKSTWTDCEPAAWAAVAGAKCPTMVDGRHPEEHDGAECWHCGGDGDLLHELRVPSHICNRIGPNFGKWEYRTVPTRIEVVPVVTLPLEHPYCEADDLNPFVAVIPSTVNAPMAGKVRLWLGHGNVHTVTNVAALEAHHGPAAGWVGKWAIVATPADTPEDT